MQEKYIKLLNNKNIAKTKFYFNTSKIRNEVILMNQKKSKISLKTINELLNKNFFIPSYQRGYRWKKRQVKELLDDIWEFINRKKEEDEFYCLQPVVIKECNEEI